MPGPTFVEDDRIDLRTVEEEDVAFLQRGTNHPEIRRYIDVFDTPRNREQQRETFENCERLDFVHEGTSRDLGFVDGEFVGTERYAPLADEWDGAESILQG